MCHCNDADDVALTPEDQAIRKPSQRHSAMNKIDLLAKRGQFEEHGSDTFHLK
jgi:hypothetical protein